MPITVDTVHNITLQELLSYMPECQWIILRPSPCRINQTMERRCSVERYCSRTEYALQYDYPPAAEVIKFYAVKDDVIIYCK